MKNRSFFFLAFVFSTSGLLAQSLEWAKGFGGNGSVDGYSMTVDQSGNVYTVGSLIGTVDLDPGLGTFNLTSNGSNDIFISKLNSEGDFVWALNMGGTNSELAYSVSADGFGNIYTTGRFSGTADFDPGVDVHSLTSHGNADVFICKLDSNGQFIWAVNMGGVSADIGYSISVDSIGNVYTTGVYSQTADFDPGTGAYDLSTSMLANVFISKLDSSGTFLWAKSIGGGSFSDGSKSISVDNQGNVYTVGTFSGTVDFDPGPGTEMLTAQGNSDMFAIKLNENGQHIWSKVFHSVSDAAPKSIAVNNNGKVVIAGTFQDTTDFDPGPDTVATVPIFGPNLFLCMLDSAGDYQWVKVLNASDGSWDRCVALDEKGNSFTTGYFEDSIDFDPGAATFNLTSNGVQDIFILKLDSLGDFDWAKSMGGAQFDKGTGICTGQNEEVYSIGYFNDTVDFDPGTGIYMLPAIQGTTDVYVLKLSNKGFVNTYQASELDITVYPNPTNGIFRIESDGFNTVIIYNSSGEIVGQTDSNIIDISSYPVGLYIVEIQTANDTCRKKVLKL